MLFLKQGLAYFRQSVYQVKKQLLLLNSFSYFCVRPKSEITKWWQKAAQSFRKPIPYSPESTWNTLPALEQILACFRQSRLSPFHLQQCFPAFMTSRVTEEKFLSIMGKKRTMDGFRSFSGFIPPKMSPFS